MEKRPPGRFSFCITYEKWKVFYGMADEPKDRGEKDDWEARRDYWRGRRMHGGWLVRVILGLILAFIIFMAGVAAGRFSTYFGGYGYGFGPFGPMMRGYFYGPGYNPYYYGYPQPQGTGALPQATSSTSTAR